MNRAGRLHRLGEGIGSGLRRWRALLAVGIFVAAFVGLASDLLIQRYLAFQTSAWDLGNYNQAFYDTLYGHGFFYYTADLPSGNGGQLFTAHFSPILLALLPFYSVAPGPPTLLVLETLAAGLAALPFYVFARGELRSARWATALAAAFLASPVLLGILWYDFHPEAFLPVAVLSALVCYRSAGGNCSSSPGSSRSA